MKTKELFVQLLITGNDILKGITYVPSGEYVTRLYDVYSLSDNLKYESWKNDSIRLLSRVSPDDFSITDFRNASVEFEKTHYSPDKFRKMLGILNSFYNLFFHDVSEKENELPKVSQLSYSKDIFIVHGRDEAMKEKVKDCIKTLKLNPIILSEQPNGGKTIIEKFESNTSNIGFAIVLMSACDMGRLKTEKKLKPRSRQNVILELGYFWGKLGRGRVFTLKDDDVELPSDILGVAYTSYDSKGAWRMELVKELLAAGYSVDANDLL